jgi:hypothetical protein
MKDEPMKRPGAAGSLRRIHILFSSCWRNLPMRKYACVSYTPEMVRFQIHVREEGKKIPFGVVTPSGCWCLAKVASEGA